MAALDTPLVAQLLTPPQQRQQPSHLSFPATTAHNMPVSRQEAKSTILAQFPPGQQPAGTSTPIPDSMSNLLDSTPPQIVRALGQAEPLIRGLNTLLGLLTWTSGQDWLSFFLVVGWWITCLYGSYIVKYLGNFVPVIIIVAWYTLHKNVEVLPERTSTHASLSATLKEIDILRTRITLFLTPPSLLLPHLSLPGSQPLLIRLCASWPIWLLITHKILPPRKVVMALGTAALCWSAPWARVICIALWRSRTVRKVSGLIIGEDLLTDDDTPGESIQPTAPSSLTEPPKRNRHEKQSSTNSIRDVLGGGIKITQTLYQSQRRWIGVGWTNSLLPNDKSAWADETEHAALSKEEFALPHDRTISHTLPTGEQALRVARWKWLDLEWKPVIKPNETDADGWIYTDNTWKNPGPSEAFGKYTRRRKFLRTSELTEEIIPVEAAETSSGIGSPIISQQSRSTATETPGSLNARGVSRNATPSAVRPEGSEPGGGSIENDIRDAVERGL